MCGTEEIYGKGWCVDHDHKTKQVRGILCQNCNSALGYLKDDYKLAEIAVAYLKGFQSVY
jgi:hypothetical protein